MNGYSFLNENNISEKSDLEYFPDNIIEVLNNIESKIIDFVPYIADWEFYSPKLSAFFNTFERPFCKVYYKNRIIRKFKIYYRKIFRF